MLLPNKTIRYEKSIISKFPSILKVLQGGTMNPKELYDICGSGFEDVNEFIQAIDCLYALGKVQLNSTTGRIELC